MQSFLLSYMMRSAPRPPLYPSLPSASCLLSQLHVCGRLSLQTREGGGGGRGAKLYDGEKAWPSINHSKLNIKSSLYGGPFFLLLSRARIFKLLKSLKNRREGTNFRCPLSKLKKEAIPYYSSSFDHCSKVTLFLGRIYRTAWKIKNQRDRSYL